MASISQAVTPGVCLTRGVPFDPARAPQAREVEQHKAKRREEMREHGRKLDQEARERRIQVEKAWQERARDRRHESR